MTARREGNAQVIGFTRETQRKLSAMRMIAYSLASLFMIVMAVRGVWLTRDQMEAEANRSIQSAAAMIAAMPAARGFDPSQARQVLQALSPPGVEFRLSNTIGDDDAAAEMAQTASPSEVRIVRVGNGPWSLVSVIDHAAIWRIAFRANLPYLLFVLALGLPVIAIFLYMGWLVNRPALELLAFAQSVDVEDRPPPKLPTLWNPALVRLQQLKDNQAQMQAFLDHAPIGMMFRNPAGQLVMMNRYGASFYDLGPDDMASKPMAFFDAYFPDSERLAKPLFLDPLTKAEITSVETEFQGPSGERMTLLVKSFPVLNNAGVVELVGSFFVDVSDERRAEAERRQSQALFEGFIQNSPAPMALTDPVGNMIKTNDAAATYYGQAGDVLLTASRSEIIEHWPEFETVIAPASARLFETLETQHVDTKFKMPSGEIRDFALSLFPIVGDDGKLAFQGTIVHDLTEERRMQAALDESRSQLIAFFDNLPTSIYLKQIDHKVIYVSKHLAEQYGKRPEDMIGQHEYDLHIDAMKPLLKMMDEQILSTGQAILTEGEHLQFDRQELVSRFPVFNDKGEITHIGGMNFDIDERAKAQAELKASKALVDAFIQNAPNTMVLMKPSGKYVMFNNAAARYYDMTPDELLAAGPKTINPPFTEGLTKIGPMVTRVVANLKAEAIETPFVTASGDVRTFAFWLFPIFGADGEVAFIGNISHDVTDERRAQAELAKSADALHQSEKLAALGSMLAGVSHELNNPLAAVIGQAALLAEDLEGTPHVDRVSKIRRAADRCARIVQSFLAMARQKAPEYRSVCINDQVRSAVELTEYQMRAAQVTLDLRLADNLPKIEADPDELHQVIANLLTNARQALEEVSGERKISITTSREQHMIRLAVADNGKGIDAATRDRIFDPFFTTKAVGAGTGIGLSYSLGIIEAHGGTIKIEDAELGTVFVIALPVKDEMIEAAAPEQPQEAKAKGRALVVDDEADVAEMLADMLERLGLDVTIAIGGLAGQAVMAEGAAFDLVLSDIRMPDLDGPALYEWTSINRPDLLDKIAFVTGDTLGGLAADFLAKAGCPVLEKPFSPLGLRTLVAELLGSTDGEIS